jgi:hypothetical protein
MLHIITPLYRFELIEKVCGSIPLNEDVVWHISYSSKRELPNLSFLNDNKQIRLYPVDCEDNDTPSKRNEILKEIKDGYFCFLDDDTVFHENMYFKYQECMENNFKGMLVGEQIDNDGKLRLIASKPVFRRIDTGNVIAHHDCLTECRWPETFTWRVNQRDFLFWESVYNYYEMKCAIWNTPISYYNKLRDE